MKKRTGLFFLFFVLFFAKSQLSAIDSYLNKMEDSERETIEKLKNTSLEDKKFTLIKQFKDHLERSVVIFEGNEAVLVELFDDKKSGETTAKIFTGDFVRTENNIISVRCDQLEGQKIPIPVTKTFLLSEKRGVLYLIDINRKKERWIDQSAIKK
ncbi:MAG: hypothetical protein FDW93_06620 [Bergeyella sp.]|nr:hypothetical protein [Bergeyella sp.]